MLKKGDAVIFVAGETDIYRTTSEPYEHEGHWVVDIEFPKREAVKVKSLAKLQTLFTEDF